MCRGEERGGREGIEKGEGRGGGSEMVGRKDGMRRGDEKRGGGGRGD